MTLSRRSLVGSAVASLLLPRRAHAGIAALSAAVLAISKSKPISVDALDIASSQGKVSLQDQRGKLVILNLWASWCLPCRREMPSLSRLALQLKGTNCAILPVSFDRKGLEAVSKFYEETGITNLPLLAGDLQNLQQLAGDLPLPSTWIVDAKGLMRWTVTGEAQWDDADTLRWLASLITS